MKSLIWKEFHENLKWAVLVLLLIGGLMKLNLRGTDLESVMSPKFLTIMSLVGAAFAAILGFLQFCSESHGDRRALLLHRPIRPSRIYMAKSLTGLSLYALALGIPFACAVAWAATPGKVAAPFRWPMVLPGLADILTGTAYYFAGVLTAQREARWYGSRGLGLVTAIFCSACAWLLPEFRHAVVAIVILSGLLAVAARGAFVSGGSYGFTPRFGKAALAAMFLIALIFMGLTAPALVETWLEPSDRTWHILNRQGEVWIVHNKGGDFSVTDLAGQTPPQLRGQLLDGHVIRQLQAVTASLAIRPKVHWYRFPDRMFLPLPRKTGSPGERWFYVFDQARLQGYDLNSRRLIGSIGPDGFVPAAQHATARFDGELHYMHGYFIAGIHSADFLAFSNRAYVVDYDRRTVKAIYTPDFGQTILVADARDDKTRDFLGFMLTEKGVYATDANGTRVFSAPLVFNRNQYRLEAARLGGAPRFAVWYFQGDAGSEPISVGKLAALFLKHVLVKHWPLPGRAKEASPSYLVEFDADGKELGRQIVPPIVEIESRPAQALYGLVTPPAGYVLYAAVDRMYATMVMPHEGSALLFWFTVLMAVSAAASAVACYLMARRYAFSHARRLLWLLCGLLAGPYGLLLMLSVTEWPARVGCPACGRLRVVTRDMCERCGAARATPAPDGTEIFETTTAGGGAIRDAIYETASSYGEDRA